MFCRLLRYLAGPLQEETLLRWLPKAPEPMSRDVALALGHLLSDRPLTEIVPLINDDGSLRDRALLYGLGHAALGCAARASPSTATARPYLRDAALWWMRQGGAIRV